MKKSEKLFIDITFELLYKKGYDGTSITELLDIANLTKGSVYYHFKSKHILVLATIKHYLEFILEEHWVKPLKESNTPIETLINQINAYHNMFADDNHFLQVKHGCPLSNFISDMSDQDSEIFDYLSSVYTRWQLAVEDALLRADTKTAFDAKKQALYIISSIEGSIGSAKAHNNIQSLKDCFEILNNYIETL